jgi:P4 family phage/plasmid primase-like protien
MKDDNHFGEIIAQGTQVVGPGSIHPDTGTKYDVVKDVEIATISRELVFSELMEYMPIAYPKRDLKTEIGDISVMDVLDKAGVQLRQVGSQLVCGHPIHGSTNDNNFVANPDKNAWHCFRCDSGGGAIFLVAVLESIIECCDAKPGGLRGDKFKQTLNIAKEKYEFDIDDRENINLNEICSLLSFASLGDKKKAFFAEITANPNKVADFVKEYAVNPRDSVPERNYEIKPDRKRICHYEPLTEAKIFMCGLHLIFYAEQLYLYRNGWYQLFNERFFLKLIEHQIHAPFKAHRRKAIEILEMVKDNLQDADLQVNICPDLINLKNGLLNIDTFKLIPHTPEEKYIYQINAHYDPKAKCKRFEAFLQEILVTEDKLASDKELIRLVQQFMGYILYLRIPFHKCLMLYGKGRNGKSVLVFVILELLKGLCSHVHFESIGVDMFATSDLAGKLLNVSSELSATAKLKDGDIKKIIGGDELRAQRKFQPSFNFRPFAKHIICTNNLPKSRDKSLGFFSKFTIVPLHKIYLSKEDYDLIEDEETRRQCAVEDGLLEDKLKEEMNGIMQWALFGLKDLLTNKGFCVPVQVQKLKKVFEIRSTSVESFFEERVDDSDSTENTPSPTLYQAYIKYCKEYKIPPETNRVFLTSVKNLGYEIRPGSKNVNFVQGVCLKVEG